MHDMTVAHSIRGTTTTYAVATIGPTLRKKWAGDMEKPVPTAARSQMQMMLRIQSTSCEY